MSTKVAQQRGLIGILLLVTIAVMAVAVFSKNIWGEDPKAYREKVNREALKQAKAALLDYLAVSVITNTVNDPFSGTNTIGRLPCPDQLGNGVSDTNCGIGASTYKAAGYHSLGLFPWSTVNSPVIRDASQQCLWYAVDGLYKSDNPTSPVNSDSNGSFSIVQPVKPANASLLASTWPTQLLTGDQATTTSSVASRAVAVIIAPGAAGGTQQQASFGGSTYTCGLTQGTGAIPNAEKSAPDFLKFYSPSTSLGGITYPIISNQSLIPTSGVPAKNVASPAITPLGALVTFVTADIGQEQLNDQITWITADEVASAATKRMAQLYVNRINLYVSQTGFYPWAASTPGGPCIKDRLQGYIPYDCDVYPSGAKSTTPPSFVLAFGDQGFYNDVDRWAGQAHYAVSKDCVAKTSITVSSVVYPLAGSGGTTTKPCSNGTDRINLGAGTDGPAAIILMRGRRLSNQSSCVLYDPANKATTSNVSLCLEDTTNIQTVGNAFTAPKTYPTPMYNNSWSYRVPQTSGSNDYMVQFKVN